MTDGFDGSWQAPSAAGQPPPQQQLPAPPVGDAAPKAEPGAPEAQPAAGAAGAVQQVTRPAVPVSVHRLRLLLSAVLI